MKSIYPKHVNALFSAGKLFLAFFAAFMVAGLIILGFVPVFYGWRFHETAFWYAALALFSLAYWTIVFSLGLEIEG